MTKFPDSILLDNQLLIFMGFGGSGKTTLAWEMAFKTALLGKKVTLLTTSTLNHFPSLKKNNKLPSLISYQNQIEEIINNKLITIEYLNTKETLEKIILNHFSSKDQANNIFNNSLYQYASKVIDGLLECLFFEKLEELNFPDSSRLIIIDTPPSNNIINMLEASKRIKKSLDSPFLKIANLFYSGGRANAVNKILDLSSNIFLGLSGILDKAFIKELFEFTNILGNLQKDYSKKTDKIEKLFRTNIVKKLLICEPQQKHIEKIELLKKQIEKVEMKFDLVLLNKTHFPFINDNQAVPNANDPQTKKIISQWNNAHLRENYFSEKLSSFFNRKNIFQVPYIPQYSNNLFSATRLLTKIQSVE